MATRALEELDGGLGSCQAGEDLSTLVDPCQSRALEDTAPGTSRLLDLSSLPHDSPADEGLVEVKPKKTEKEPVVKRVPSPGKEKLKAPRSAPARKKVQTAPPQPPPPPPPASDELPWGDVTLNKCLVLASLVALVGSAFQLCHDAVIGREAVPAPAPELWVPPSAAPKARAPSPPKPAAWVPPPAPPAPQTEADARPEAPGSREAAEEHAEPSEATETPGEDRVDGRPKKRPPGRERRQDTRPRREKDERRRKERRWREKEAGAGRGRELRGAPRRRQEARAGSWAGDSGDTPRHKKATWGSRSGQTSSEERPARHKLRAGRGRG